MSQSALQYEELHRKLSQCNSLSLDEADLVAYAELLLTAPRLAFAIYHHRTTHNTVMSWDDRPWLMPLYCDTSDKIVIRKCSQVGITDWALNELFSQAYLGHPVLYVLPTDEVVYGFSPRRVDKLVDRVPYYEANYRKARKDSDSKKQKTLFGTDCRLVGSNSPKNFFEVPCDVLIIDEVDLCVQDNLVFAKDRLLAAKDESGIAREIWRMLGNPSISGAGIDKVFETSDKKRYHVPCPHCNEKQILDWQEHFVRQDDNGRWVLRDPEFHLSSQTGDGDARPLCRRCNKPMDRLARGEWVAEHPGRDISGWDISRLFADPRSGQIIVGLYEIWLHAQSNQTELQHFYNQVLGKPYSAEGSGISRDLLRRCASEYTMPDAADNTVAGVDVGGHLHVHISTMKNGIRRKVFVGTVGSFDDLHILAHRYRVEVGVIDAQPEERLARSFCETHPGWYTCRYITSESMTDPIIVDHVSQEVKTKRTPSLDESLAHIAEGRVELPVDWESLDNGDFVAQMTAATRIKTINSRGQEVYVWDEANKADHHQHADNYERIAASMFGGGVDSMLRII